MTDYRTQNSPRQAPQKVSEPIRADDYFFETYGSFILLGMNMFLQRGMISRLLGLMDIPIQPITSENCRITGTHYWWVNRTTFLADIAIILTLNTPRGCMQSGFQASLQVDVAHEEETNFVRFQKYAQLPDRKGEMVPLDGYLVPYMNSKDIESACEDLLDHYYPSWQENGCVVDPELIAAAKGLQIVYLPLKWTDYHRNSVLFFEDGYVTTLEGDKVPVDAGTIVINTFSTANYKIDARNIHHELFHDEYHYLAYWLQKRANSNPAEFPSRLEGTDSIDDDDLERCDSFKNPLTAIESQAFRAELRLLLPRQLFTPVFDGTVETINLLPGPKYDLACRQLASRLDLPKAAIKSRALQLGHHGAAGCLNWIPDHNGVRGHYAACFSFGEIDFGQTYFITPQELEAALKHSPELTELMKSGQFVYADGHVCINSPLAVRTLDNGGKLTDEALRAVDRCCLPFIAQYIYTAPGVLKRGVLFRDDESIERTAFFLRDYLAEGKMIVRAKKEYIAARGSLYFPELLMALRTDAQQTQFDLACNSGLSEKTIQRLETGKTKKYTFDVVALLAKGLMLPFWITEMLFKAAGLSPTDEREETIIYFLTYYIKEPVPAMQAFMEDNNFKALKALTSSKAAQAMV